MANYPVEIRRCQHIKTNGTQCGSPALREETFCYYHSESRPERVKVAGEGGGAGGEILFPVLEDAHSVQVVVRQVAMLVLEGKIDNKKAGLVLYALQIASSNLKRMEEEKPRPVQVVVDPKKVEETPLGMTPWSGNEQGHEAEVVLTRSDEENEERETEYEWMSQQFKEFTEWLERQITEAGNWAGDEKADAGDMRLGLRLMKARLEEALEANREHHLLSEMIYYWPANPPSKENAAQDARD
jgi:hypothetical protein